MLYEVVVTGCTSLHTDTATSLCLEFGQRSTLDVTHVTQRNDNLIIGIEVLCIEFFCAGHNLSLTFVSELILHFFQFVLDYLAAEFIVSKNLIVVLYLLLQLVIFCMQFFLLQTCELAQAHINNGLGLYFIQREALHQAFHSHLRRLATLDDTHYLINVVACNNKSGQNVGTLFCLAQIVFCTADNHLMTVCNKVRDAVAKSKQAGTSLYKCDAVHAEAGLEGRHLEQFVEHNAGIGIAFYINNNAHTFLVRLIIDVTDTFKFLVCHHLGDRLNQLGLIYAIRYFSNHNLVMLVARFNIGLGTQYDSAASGLVSVLYTLQTHDIGSGGEVGTLDILHQVFVAQLVIVYKSHTSINNLAQVMSGNVGGHTYGNTGCSVNKKVGNAGRHNGGFLQRIVEVVGHIHSFLLQVFHHGLAHQAQSSLGITHGCGAVAVD